MAIKTAAELAAACKDVAQNHKTLYVMGCFGAPMTASNKTRYIKHHSYNQKTARTAKIKAATADTFGFDCVCLIKGLLWGWSGDKSKTYGGAGYACNNVPDIGANQMIKVCKNVSTDFSTIQVGEAVWMQGHIGVYIGDGLAVECTPKWADCVQITAVHNIGTKAGYNGRKWTKHGRLPYVTYTGQAETAKPTETKKEGADMVTEYSKTKDGSKQLATNFKVREFACKCSRCSTVLIDGKLVEYLQKIREHFGAPVNINSGYRCPEHNAEVGGASGSRHKKGQAADIVVEGVKPAEVAKYAESIGVLGIGLYETAKDGYFCHIDTRTSKSFWYGQACAYRSTFGGSAAASTSKPTEPAQQASGYTLEQFIRDVQKATGAAVDGVAGPETIGKTVTLSAKKNAKHAAVEAVQKRLAALGYAEVGKVDGVAGPKFTSAVAHFQQDNGCVVDGEITAGKKTWRKLLGM